MKPQHRQAVIECLAAVATSKKTSNQAEPVVDLLSVNNKMFGPGWICSVPVNTNKKRKQVELNQCDKYLYAMLCLALSSSSISVGEKRGLVLDAFGLSRHHRTGREIAKAQTHQKTFDLLLRPTKDTGSPPSKESQQDNSIVSTPAAIMKQAPPETPVLSESEGEGEGEGEELIRGNLFAEDFPDDKQNAAKTKGNARHVFRRKAGSIFRHNATQQHKQSSSFASPLQPTSKKRAPVRQSPAIANFDPGSKFATARARNRLNQQEGPSNGLSTAVSADIDDNFQCDDEDSTNNLPNLANELILAPSLSALELREESGRVKLTEDYLAQKAAHNVISRLPAKNGIVTLSFYDRQKKLRSSNVMVLPIPRIGKKAEDAQNKKLRAHRKAAKVKSLVDSVCLDDAERDLLLQEYAELYTEFRLVKEDGVDKRLNIQEAICIRDFIGTSTNGVCRLAKALKILAGIECFPLGLKKRIAEKEREAVPMNCQYAELTVSKEKKLCLFLSCSNPALLLERMIASSHVAGKQRDSFEISNYRDSNLIFLGLDRGGGDIYLGMRNGNRSNGNQANFCFPLAVVEDASEDYTNVKDTFFGTNTIVERMHQDLIDDAIHTIEILVKDKAGKLAGVACVAVRLLPSDWNEDRFCHATTKVTIQRRVDFTIKLGAIRGIVVEAGNRDRATPVVVPSLLSKNNNQPLSCTLEASLLLDPTVGYIGLRLCDLSTNDIILTHLFDKPIDRPVEGRGRIKCNLVRGFPAHDGKCALCISGQASASSAMPCLRCIAEKSTFRRFPSWMHKHRPNQFPQPATADASDRCGEYSNLQCYKVFTRETGDGMYSSKAVKTDVKKQSYSVVHPPCASVNPIKESGGPMHISSGIIDHLIDDTRKMLKAIDAKGPLMQELESLKIRLTAIVKAPLNATESSQKVHDAEYAKCIERGKRKLESLKAGPDSVSNNAAVAATESQIKQMQEGRFNHAASTGFGFNNLLKKGAEELLELLETFLSSKGKKVCGEAEYVFNKAIELTGAKFRKEHGGMSLSNADSIKVAERYELVANAVKGAYKDIESLRSEVDGVMDIFCRLAEPSRRIALLLKSQGKMMPEKVTRLKDAVCDFSFQFREVYPHRPVHPKLHYLECIIVRYAIEHGFIGLGSEEGFESAHNRLRWIKTMLISMPATKDRGEKMGQRYQISLLDGFEETWQKLNPLVTTRSCGSTYNTTKKQSKIVERLYAAKAIDAGLVRLSSGSIIHESWREYYDFLCFNVATDRMKAALENDSSNALVEAKPDLGKLIDYVS